MKRLIWDRSLDRRRLEFSGYDHDGGQVSPPGFCNAIGMLQQ